MKRKIIKLSQEAGYYYSKALDKSDKDDFIGCLELLRRAQNLVNEPYGEEDLSIRLEIADTLAFMGLYEESNREYFKMTAFDYCSDDVFYGLIKNYAMMDMNEQAAYYLNFGVESGVLLAEDGFEPIDFDLVAKPVGKSIRLVKPNDNSHTVRVAKQLLGSEDSDFARQMLKTVPENSDQYAEAANYLALLEISEGNTAEGLKLCDRVLQDNESDIYALTTRILALEMAGKEAEAKAEMEALDAMDIDVWPETAKIALCACQTGNNETAYKYLNKSLKAMPYDRDLLLLFMLAAANLGKYRDAKNAAVTLRLIYPLDAAVRYFSRELDRYKETPAAFELVPELPKEQRLYYGELLDKALERAGGSSVFMNHAGSDPELFEAARWGLYSGNAATQIKLGRLFAREESGYPYIREILVDPDYPIIPKKEIFTELLRADKIRMIQMVVNHEIRWFRPSIPKEVKNKTLAGAYRQVYSALAFIDEGFERKLNIWYKKLAAAFKAAGLCASLNENAAAAVLAYKSRINKIFASKAAAVEVFDCPEEIFTLYLNKTEEYFQKGLAKKRGGRPRADG